MTLTDEIMKNVESLEKEVYRKAFMRGFFTGWITALVLVCLICWYVIN